MKKLLAVPLLLLVAAVAYSAPRLVYDQDIAKGAAATSTTSDGLPLTGVTATSIPFAQDNAYKVGRLFQFAKASDNGVLGYALVSNGDNTFRWAPGGAATSIAWDNITGKPSTFAPASHTHSGVYEPVLGNPSVTGYVLSSTTGGVRSWVAQSGGGGGTTSLPWDNVTGKPTTLLGYGIAAIDNEVIGGTTPRAGTFTTLTADNVSTGVGVDGGRWFEMGNNTVPPTTTSKDGIFFLGNVLKVSENGTQRVVAKTDGNVATATALAANGANCSAGQANLGVDASGAAEGCWTPGGGSDIWPTGGAVDNSIALLDNTTGKLKNSPVTIGPDNVIRGASGISTTHVDNTAYWEAMNSGPPGTCNASRHGWTYFDNTLHTERVCDTNDTWTDIGPYSGGSLADNSITGAKLISNIAINTTGLIQGRVYTVHYTDNATLSAAQCSGGFIYVDNAATITLPAIGTGMNVVIYGTGANLISVQPNASDRIVLNGTPLADAATITSPATAGSTITLIYDSAAGWTTFGRVGSWTSP